MTTDIDKLLEERGERYGKFSDRARLTQKLKEAMVLHSPHIWQSMRPSAREALEMIAHKIGRILCGDPDYVDSWDDIAGYAKLVSNELNEEQKDDTNA